MDDTTSPATTAPTGATPFPTDAAKPADAKPAAPVGDGLIKRVTQGAHDAVDDFAAKVSSLTDGLQGGIDKVGDTRDEWIASARDAIRQHPFAAVAGALVVGAALLSLRSSRDN